MPARRKNKAAIKTARATAQPKHHAPVGAIRVSAAKRRSSGSGLAFGASKTSPSGPSEPLHMTLRGAVKASNRTSPALPSGASTRRNSLDDLAEQQPLSAGEDEDSGSPPNQMGSSFSQPDVVETESKPPSRKLSNASVTHSKKRRASEDSGQTSKTATPNGLVRSESDLSEKQPRRKKRKTTDAGPEPEVVDAPPELTDSSTPPGSPDLTPEVAPSQGLKNVLPSVNGEMPAKAGRRLPGRRRQPHSNMNVEVNLRRQLNLKMNYRAVAKLQKGILEELAKRSLRNLEDDAEFHKQCPQYEVVMADLDRRLKGRMDQIEAERKEKLGQLERLRVAEEKIQREQYINRFGEYQDNFILQCLYRMKQLERQMRAEQSGYATDDEEHIVEPTHMQFPQHHADDRLGSKFASRSRAYVETERMLEDEERRDAFDQLRRAFLAENPDCDDSIKEIPEDFATFTGPDRSEALAHYNVDSLVNAAEEVERVIPQLEPPKVIPNEQASALFMLASLSAERPSEVTEPSQHGDSIIGSTVASAGPSAVPSRVHSTVQSRGSSRAPSRVTTPAQQVELPREVSPLAPLSATSEAMSLETPRSTPARTTDVQETAAPTESVTNGISAQQAPSVPEHQIPVRVSTHRIMDMLNNEPDEEAPRLRGDEKLPIEQGQLQHACPLRIETQLKDAAGPVSQNRHGLDQEPATRLDDRAIVDAPAIAHQDTPKDVPHDAHQGNTTDSAVPSPRLEDKHSEPVDAPLQQQSEATTKPPASSETSANQGRRGSKSTSKSPCSDSHYWSSKNVTPAAEQPPAGDSRSPLNRLKLMLEKKNAREAQARSRRASLEEPPFPTAYRSENEDFAQSRPTAPPVSDPLPSERENEIPRESRADSSPKYFDSFRETRDGLPDFAREEAERSATAEAASQTRVEHTSTGTHGDMANGHGGVDRNSRPLSPRERSSTLERPSTGKAPLHPTSAAYSPTTSARRHRSPSEDSYVPQMATPGSPDSRDRHDAPYSPRSRHHSHDQTSRENGRRGSGDARVDYDYRYTDIYGRARSAQHQSPYPPPSGSHLPGPSPPSSLPPKPPAGPSQSTVNFRFAHYDPAPTRSPYRTQSTSYPPRSHHPPLLPASYPSTPQPRPVPGAEPPLPPSFYRQPYGSGYVPPAGSFQAPPPPQSAPLGRGYVPPPPPPQYIPVQQHWTPAYQGPPAAPRHHYEHANPPTGPASHGHSQSHSHSHDRSQHERPHDRNHNRPEPQPRPRRQYRSWNAPGTEFRPYNGPKHHGSRR